MPRRPDAPRARVLDQVFAKIRKVKLARMLRMSKAAVGQWRRVPAEHVRRVSHLTGISMSKLRPDLYDHSR